MIAVECGPDVILVRVLGVPSKKIYHAGSKGRVVKAVEKFGGIGIIDEDPGCPQPKLLLNYSIAVTYEQLGIRILTRNNKRIIVICPRLEEFIIEACKESKINPRKFGLPLDPAQFHRKVNSRLRNFKMLLETLLKVKNRRMKILRKIITFHN